MTSSAPLQEYYPDGDSRQASVLAPEARYNPWKHVYIEYPDVRLSDDLALPDRVMGLCRAKRIWLDKRLNQAERRCTLAHELVHIERGPVPPDPEMAALEEEIVDEIASRRLIAGDDLIATIRECPSGGLQAWAFRLWVDTPMLTARLKTLRANEIEAIESIKAEAQSLTRAVERIARIREPGE
ncbi:MULTISPECIES: ImmA/IrrE family metallo-endopeptidase [Mycobacteriaceae]|uniref:IrrE N-terminal-like domain-containing protein n=1 Tax=Mycolicibacterium neoaurum VKM Ac-1815D TaxID=700508 RepID=V5X8U6_MYCNE|nr:MULTISPECIES: ImmA/IrrE family metallo-endopeptidase [Mycobacteriaceae]AXK77196.1 ImmA/IrrE family metallo-endopeptidase [Mycolicibacterium neoaurum]